MTAPDLKKLLNDTRVGIEDISDALDRAQPAERIEAVFALDRSAQRSLYERAAKAPAITLEHFVPPDRGPLEPVHHRGRNTLPLPSKHKLFEKRFCRPGDGSSRLFGYNEAPSRRLIGPGYFVAIPTAHHPQWAERGVVVVDYFQVPNGPVPPSWPPVVANSQGLQRFVYHRTRDFMRRVSSQVCIGAAYKAERPLGHYFVLVRDAG